LDNETLLPIDEDARRLAALALAEDGPIDVTSEVTVSEEVQGEAELEVRTAGILSGTAYADAVVRACSLPEPEWLCEDGHPVSPGQRIAVLKGPLRAILRGERPLLNLLQRSCGIATATRGFVDALRGTRCRVLHTRKTLPGFLSFDVRAVLAGGGAMHRLDLSHVILIKDNHWRALERGGATLVQARLGARSRGVDSFQVEVESRAQVEAACAAGATRILVDNQPPGTLKEWAAIARRLLPAIEIEATGGIDLANVRAYAEADADFVSVGALTHSVRGLDISLEVRNLVSPAVTGAPASS